MLMSLRIGQMPGSLESEDELDCLQSEQSAMPSTPSGSSETIDGNAHAPVSAPILASYGAAVLPPVESQVHAILWLADLLISLLIFIRSN